MYLYMSKGPFDLIFIIPMGYENRVSKTHLVIAVFWGLKIFIKGTIYVGDQNLIYRRHWRTLIPGGGAWRRRRKNSGRTAKGKRTSKQQKRGGARISKQSRKRWERRGPKELEEASSEQPFFFWSPEPSRGDERYLWTPDGAPVVTVRRPLAAY